MVKSLSSILFILLINSNFIYTQIDLSQNWQFQDDLSYFNSEALQEIMDIEIPTLDLISGIIVIHNGKIVSEEYYNGSSEDDIYNIFSVTKSYISTLIGQAIDQGLLNNQYSTLDSFFPEFDFEYPHYVQLDDLLSMSSGYLDDYGEFPDYWFNTTIEELLGMNHLDGPGTFFYNNSACHIHSHILYHETGLTPKEFANIHLFPYLGINNPDWNSGNSEISNGSSGLMLNLRDMVKLGQLYLQDGYSSSDTQILSSEWIHEATSTQAEPSWSWNWNGGYGYLWWLPDRGYLAWGLGGQFIVVIPELNLVIGTHSFLTDVPNNHVNVLAGIIYNQIVPLFDEVVGVEPISLKIPLEYSLFSNYPNPFNPITSLHYDLPEDGLVNITVYDMMGRIVKTLVNSSQTAGYKSIKWNATNDRNEPVSAGLYLYTIQAGEFRQTKKMVLLK